MDKDDLPPAPECQSQNANLNPCYWGNSALTKSLNVDTTVLANNFKLYPYDTGDGFTHLGRGEPNSLRGKYILPY